GKGPGFHTGFARVLGRVRVVGRVAHAPTRDKTRARMGRERSDWTPQALNACPGAANEVSRVVVRERVSAPLTCSVSHKKQTPPSPHLTRETDAIVIQAQSAADRDRRQRETK